MGKGVSDTKGIGGGDGGNSEIAGAVCASESEAEEGGNIGSNCGDDGINGKAGGAPAIEMAPCKCCTEAS